MIGASLAVVNLVARYGAIEALTDVSFTVEQGELVAIVGANGAGKSTLLRVISGIHPATAGEILLGHRDISRMPAHERVRAGIVHVPEGRELFVQMTVRENLDLGALNRHCTSDELDRVWTMFPVLYERRGQRAGTLSGGEQQMLALARGLVANPKLLLLDEPSLGLAPRLVAQLMDLVGELNADGLTVVLVEQNAMAALRIADRAYVLASGKVALSGPADELMRDEGVRRAYLGISVSSA